MVFFFQAEDGIRDIGVTGVQTCALPISKSRTPASGEGAGGRPADGPLPGKNPELLPTPSLSWEEFEDFTERLLSAHRSEERRVGKSVDLGGRRIIKKKNNRQTRSRVHNA